MDPRDFFYFFVRHFRWLAVFAVGGALVGVLMVTHVQKPHDGVTLFMTLGLELGPGDSVSGYVTSQNQNVIDQFTETVQGWLRNPSLVSRIEEEAGFPLGVAVRKQEKQNLVVTLDLPSEGEVAVSVRAVMKTLEADLSLYRERTHAPFVVALYSFVPFSIAPSLAIYGVTGFLLALVLGMGGLLFFEYLRRRVSFPFQIVDQVGRPPLLLLCGRFSPVWTELVRRYVERFPEGVQVVRVGEIHSSLFSRLLRSMACDSITFGEAEAGKPILAVIQLGRTTEDELAQLFVMREVEFDYLILV